ncbi:unnamed protein product [Paramecium sonneborni]|uniref:Uncharacterized protein n=1 Tax=Paramecium sonneborni TaxID=65129 RepID=A0A8S1QRT4_9CILI|nr:unnamed protein product [Paramecium sonneborni]
MENRDVLYKVFEFYSKQQYIQGQYATFERQQYESSIFTVGKWMHFCRDFLIKINHSKLLELFKKKAKNSKELNFDQFIQLLNLLAEEEGINFDQYQNNLGLDNWKLCVQKMKTFQKPFQMKDKTERITDVKYQFKIYHPEVKDDQQIKQILLQRKQQNEQIKLIERKKKVFNKLQFEQKHFTKSQLLSKYPNLTELIEKLPNPSKHKFSQYDYKEQEKSFNGSQKRQSSLTWESLNQLPLATDFLKDLMDDQDNEDQYLQEYYKSQNKIIQDNSVQRVQNERQKRSISDHKQIKKVQIYSEQYSIDNINNFEIQSKKKKLKSMNTNTEQNNNENFISLRQVNQKLMRQEKQQLKQQNYSMELGRQNKSNEQHEISFIKDKSVPNKLNISMLKRVQQISGLEAIKEQNLLNQIIQKQREKQKIVQK